jgi:lipopolysaccharide heptosyltransferase II
MNKILVRGADTVGSFVLATPFYRELRKNFPNSKIILCVKPLVYELAKECPYVDGIILYEPKNFFQKIRFVKYLRKENFGTVFLISGSFESAIISFFSGIKNRIGYPHDHRGFLLTKKIVEKEKKHYVDYILNILEELKLKVSSRETEVYVKNQETKFDNLISKHKIVIGLNFTVAGEPAREWPREYAVKLIQKLLQKNFEIILFGTKKDVFYSNYVESKIRDNNFINLVGKTTLTDFVNIVKKCFVYVSVATGGIHIAASLGVKVVGLYCSGDEIGWAPVGKYVTTIQKNLDCAPCTQHKMKYCKDNKCMKQISVDEVYQKIISYL